MVQRLFHLSIALLLALTAHALALWAIGQQMHAVRGALASPLEPRIKAVFARQIPRPVANVAPVAAPVTAPRAPPQSSQQVAVLKNNAPATLKKEALNPVDNLPSELAAATPAPSLAVSSTGTVGPFTDTLAMQGAWPVDTRLTYDLSGFYHGELTGTATLLWTRDTTPQGETYELRLDLVGGTLTALLTSQGRLSDAALQPQGYAEQWPGLQRSVVLDGLGVVLADGKRLPRPMEEGGLAQGFADVQDMVSQLMALGRRFANGRTSGAPGEVMRVWQARPGAVQEWEYELSPVEAMTVQQLGTVQTYHLKPRGLPTPAGAMSVEMWLAADLRYLPVRIKLTQDGSVQLDLKAQKIEQR
jgi:Protein of unknown function (DUF3108)